MTLPAFGPDFDANECMEILRMAAAVSGFLPDTKSAGNGAPILDPTQPWDQPPIIDTVAGNGGIGNKPLPSLFYHRWPEGWTAGIHGVLGAEDHTWVHSIMASDDSLFANQALIAYNEEAKAYCLAIRGTVNLPNVLEDLEFTAAPAGPVDFINLVPKKYQDYLQTHFPKIYDAIKDLKSDWWYGPNDIPGTSERAEVHAGFRLALESLQHFPNAIGKDVSLTYNRLFQRLQVIAERHPGETINLYVTGHSLGAGMASLAAAWLKTQPIPGATFNVKCYAFAQPKPGNDYFDYLQGLSFGQGGFYAVINSLDTIPQIPPTTQRLTQLNYFGAVEFLTKEIPDAQVVIDIYNKLPNANYVHAGQRIVLPGVSIMEGADSTKNAADFYGLPMDTTVNPNGRYPAYLFAAPDGANPFPPESEWQIKPSGQDWADADYGDPKEFAPLWQHLPWSYMQALQRVIDKG